MININRDEYRRMSADLLDLIGERNYFKGSVSINTDKWDGWLNCVLIIYRDRISYPEGDSDEIVDIIPVWWEFHTIEEDGEVLNDFRFDELKRYITIKLFLSGRSCCETRRSGDAGNAGNGSDNK